MFGKRCTLCGSKLDRNKICTECGLDNTKNDENYILNRSSCDEEPLTHVHEEEPVKKKGHKSEYRPKKAKAEKKKGKLGCLIPIIVFIMGSGILPLAYELVTDVTHEIISSEQIPEENNYDPYEYIAEELPETGESAGYELTSGTYIVGVHIAPGNYVAETFDIYDAIEVRDDINSIYLYEYMDKEVNWLEDLRLYEGAVVTITTGTKMILTSENAQTAVIGGIENPLTESFTIKSGQRMTAGVDFEAGVYDVTAAGEYGYLNLVIYGEDGEEPYIERQIYLGEGYTEGETYQNLAIPENATIECVEEIEFNLEPSEMIPDTNSIEEMFYGFY